NGRPREPYASRQSRTVLRARGGATFPARLRRSCSRSPANADASPVEPHVFHAQPVVDRVDEHRVALDVGTPAGAGDAVIENRTGDVLGHFLLDLPDQLPAFLLVAFHRLPVDQLVELGAAIAVVVALGVTGVVLVERLVRLVEAVADQVEADREILLRQPREPHWRINQLQLAVDVDFLQLVDQQYRRVAVGRNIAGRYL